MSAGDYPQQLLARLARWIDSGLLLGVSSLDESRIGEAKRLEEAFETVGLVSVSSAIQSLLDAPATDIVDRFGNLAVIFELTQESLQLERLAHGNLVLGGDDGAEELDDQDAP